MIDTNAIRDAVQAMRDDEFAGSKQLSLGQAIEKLENIIKERGENIKIRYDFAGLIPTKLDSWRGSYNELALGYDKPSYGGIMIGELLSKLKAAIGKSVYGGRGREFEVTEDTPIWCDNEEEYTETAIIDIIDKGHIVIIITEHITCGD